MTVGLCTLDMLLTPQPFDELSAVFVAASVVLGLEHLHCSNVIYRGLSVHSIIVTEGGQVQLVDFRFARKNEGRAYTLCGNPEYLAPEVIQVGGRHRCLLASVPQGFGASGLLRLGVACELLVISGMGAFLPVGFCACVASVPVGFCAWEWRGNPEYLAPEVIQVGGGHNG